MIQRGESPYRAIISGGFFTKKRLIFTAATVITFVGLTAGFYPFYGWEYLYESYLYHFIRKDHRHNNSVYWYLIYQLFDEPSSTLIGILTFVPQWSLIIVSGFALYYDLFTACFIQTWFFVIFNKVMTAQYYMWYTAFWPIILINNRFASEHTGKFVTYLCIYASCQGLWGYYANEFETNGEHTLLNIQAANFVWLFVNMVGVLSFLHFQDLHLQADFEEMEGKDAKATPKVTINGKKKVSDKLE
jgi:phosphatidylinositol glycan class M